MMAIQHIFWIACAITMLVHGRAYTYMYLLQLLVFRYLPVLPNLANTI